MSKREKLKLGVCLSLLLLWLVALLQILWGNTALVLTPMTVTSENLPVSFDGFRIAHVSDLHDAKIGKENRTLLDTLRKASPDVIVITGDILDSTRPDVTLSVHFATEAAKIAPCYYVTGNHEGRVDEEIYAKLERGLLDAGVIVLHNEKVTLERDGEWLSIAGIDDPQFEKVHEVRGYSMSAKYIQKIAKGRGYTILLSHRPQYFDRYVAAGMDLVLCGHVHGGQVRLPFVGGVFSPQHSFFPDYDAGLYTEGDTSMVVSRGVGNSALPLRINNRPEVLLIELKRA